MDPHAPLENICADYVTNGTFAAVWAEDSAKRTEPKIIQITQKGKHVTVGEFNVHSRFRIGHSLEQNRHSHPRFFFRSRRSLSERTTNDVH